MGRGRGTNGGAIIWTRRPMVRDEMERVANAVAAAAEQLAERLDGEPLAPLSPDEVLASLEDAEAELVAAEWIEEAALELQRRQQIVAEDQERRAAARW